MTKAEIVNEIAAQTGLDKSDILKAVEAFMETVKNSLTEGENVYLRGFGTFATKKRAEKVARDIMKNCAVVVPEHHIPAFKPSKTFTEQVRTSHLNEKLSIAN